MRMWTLASQKNPEQIILTEEYDIKVGALKKALSNHADEVYKNELDSTQKKIAEILFRRLCDKDICRLVKLEEVAKLADMQWEQVAAVVEKFRQNVF